MCVCVYLSVFGVTVSPLLPVLQMFALWSHVLVLIIPSNLVGLLSVLCDPALQGTWDSSTLGSERHLGTSLSG